VKRESDGACSTGQSPARNERAAARWFGRLIEERPGLPLADVVFAAAALREALHDRRGEAALRGLLEVGRFANA
jgi:hypothetical protein